MSDIAESKVKRTKEKSPHLKKGDKVKITMKEKNAIILTHNQLKNLKKQQELPEVKVAEDSKVTTASSEDPDMFEMSPSQISIPKVTTKESTGIFSPTLIPSMADKKSRRRKFKNRLPSSIPEKTKSDVESSKPKVSKERKLNLRRLFRNRQRTPVHVQEDPRKDAKPKETKQDAVKQRTETPKITIEEKSNPRKIIFRKSFNGKASRRLANGRLMLRKKKEKDNGRKDPLVESLLQIKRQKLKHRSFRRNRTGSGAGVKRPLPAILNRHKTLPVTESPETATSLDDTKL